MTDLEMYKKVEKIRQDLNDLYFEIQNRSNENDKEKLELLDKAEDHVSLIRDEIWVDILTHEQKMEIINLTR
jgi:hypothetical protein